MPEDFTLEKVSSLGMPERKWTREFTQVLSALTTATTKIVMKLLKFQLAEKKLNFKILFT